MKKFNYSKLEKFLEKFTPAQKAKVLRKIGHSQITASYIRVRGGVPAMLFYNWIKKNQMEFTSFKSYFDQFDTEIPWSNPDKMF